MSSKTERRYHVIIFLAFITQVSSQDYLKYLKDGCLTKSEALSCVKYKALKVATKTFFGDSKTSNETIRAGNMISFVPLSRDEKEAEFIRETDFSEFVEPRGFISEWNEIAKYIVSLLRNFIRNKGLRVDLPDDARTIEEEEGRGRKKRLAIIIPLLSLLATVKAKALLIPVLLSLLFIKKLLLIGAFLLPSLLSTLKACKVPHPPPYSFGHAWSTSDTADYSSGYGNSYTYSGNGNYGKDWPASRAYAIPKQQPRPTAMYITAPGPGAVA